MSTTQTGADVGSAKITTLGTITTGTWNGTAIDLASYVTGNLGVTHLNSGTNANSSHYWRGDGTWAAVSGAGSLIPLATATASSSASLAFTSLFSSSYTTYLFIFTNILPASSSILQCQLGTGAGPTYTNTGYNWNAIVQFSNANVGTNNTSDSQADLTGSNATYPVSSTSGDCSGYMYINGPNGSSNAASATGVLGFYNGTYFMPSTLTWSQAAATFTAIKFFMSTGNITSGTIDVYGILPG